MRTWFWTVLTISLAVFVAFVIHRFPGNVLIVVDQWRVQMSLAFGVLLSIAAFASLYLLIRVLLWLSHMPQRYRGWKGQRQERREQGLLEQGWTALLEGRYSHAEKTLTRLSGQSADKRRQVLATLSAARAAHEIGEFARQDELLKQAQAAAASQAADVDLNTAVAAAAADLWLQQGKADQALGALQVDHVQPMRHLHTMRLMLRVYQQMNHYEKVLELARALKKKQALSNHEANLLIEEAAAALIRERSGAALSSTTGNTVAGSGTTTATAAAATGATASATATSTSKTDWQTVWKNLKSEEKLMPEVALAGAMAFQAVGDYKEATKVLESALGDGSAPEVKQEGATTNAQQVGQDQVFNARLLMAYARAEPEQVTARLQKAEQWLAKRKQVREQEARSLATRQTSSTRGVSESSGGLSVSDADLLTTLGSLCLAAQMWGQAQRYLEQSSKLRKDARVHALLGSLFDRIGQPQRAAQHWRLATAVSAALPTLAQDAKLPAADTDADPVIPHGEGLGDFEGEAAGDQGVQNVVEPNPSKLAAKTPDASAYDEFFDSAPVTLPVDAYPSEDERKVAK